MSEQASGTDWELKLRQWCVEQALHIAAPHVNADDVLMQAEELRVPP